MKFSHKVDVKLMISIYIKQFGYGIRKNYDFYIHQIDYMQTLQKQV